MLIVLCMILVRWVSKVMGGNKGVGRFKCFLVQVVPPAK